MCLQHPCYERLNRFAASKPARIGFLILLTFVVAFTCFRLMQASNQLHATKNAKLVVIPETKDNLIYLDTKSSKNIEELTSKIDTVYDSYFRGQNVYFCDDTHPPEAGKSCNFDWKDLRSCNKENSYGYQKGRPCVFLKLRKILNWEPKYLNATELPEKIPKELKDVISDYKRKAVWLSCGGINPADEENIGPISFYPSRSYPYYYFPWKGDENYLEPIVAVEFERPQVGIVIAVKCTIWTQDEEESVEFNLLVD